MPIHCSSMTCWRQTPIIYRYMVTVLVISMDTVFSLNCGSLQKHKSLNRSCTNLVWFVWVYESAFLASWSNVLEMPIGWMSSRLGCSLLLLCGCMFSGGSVLLAFQLTGVVKWMPWFIGMNLVSSINCPTLSCVRSPERASAKRQQNTNNQHCTKIEVWV